MTASVVVAAILVAGTLVLPYSYAMARSHGFSSINIKSIDVRKSVDTIHQKVVSVKKGGSANCGKGGDSNGGSGGSANGAAVVRQLGGARAGVAAQRRSSREPRLALVALAGVAVLEPPALEALVLAQLAVLVALAPAAALQLALAVLAAVPLSCSYRLRMKPRNLKSESKLRTRRKIAEYQQDKNESRSVGIFMK